MTDSPTPDALGLIAELFSWIGLGVGLFFLGAWGIARLMRLAWVATDAVIIEGDTARWMTEDGELHERPLEPWERREAGNAEHLEVHYYRYSPKRMRVASASHAGRTFGILAAVFLGIGAIGFTGSVLLGLWG